MVWVLVLSLLSGQAIYEWVDAKGQSHFTNDEGSIPAKAKRRVTSGAPLSITPSAAGVDVGVRDAGVAASAGPDSCVVARQRVSQLEQQIEQARAQAVQDSERERQECQRMLNTQGQPAFARCMAGREEAAAFSGAAEKELESARESLRRAQVGGCR